MTFGVNAPNGLIPVNTGNGAAWNQQTNPYPIASTTSNSMFKGDPVTLSTAGTVIRATASQSVLGILDNVSFVDSRFPQFFNYSFWPGSGGVTLQTGSVVTAYVVDDPNVTFTVQETSTLSASGTPLTQAAVGNNADFFYPTAGGSTVTGISTVSLSNNTSATTLLGNAKIVGIDTRITLGVPGISGTVGGVQVIGTAFQNWLCQFNNHIYKAGSTRP